MSNVDWSKAPEWADQVIKSKHSGKVYFGDGEFYLYQNGEVGAHGRIAPGSGSGVSSGLGSTYYFEYTDFEVIETRPDAWQEGEKRMNNIGRSNGNDGEHYDEVVKQERYKKENGMDKIDEWARDKTRDQFRTIMWAMCEKYESRLGKKDAIVKEVGKMADYMHRWSLYEQQWAGEE